jgi:hypothetical protein
VSGASKTAAGWVWLTKCPDLARLAACARRPMTCNLNYILTVSRGQSQLDS